MQEESKQGEIVLNREIMKGAKNKGKDERKQKWE